MTVWVAFSRGEFHGHDVPPGPRVFVGVYGTREEALENCWPKGDALWVEGALSHQSAREVTILAEDLDALLTLAYGGGVTVEDVCAEEHERLARLKRVLEEDGGDG